MIGTSQKSHLVNENIQNLSYVILTIIIAYLMKAKGRRLIASNTLSHLSFS